MYTKIVTFLLPAALIALLSITAPAEMVPDRTVLINEFMADNADTLTNSLGTYTDWIEIYNTSNQPVALNNWYMTDNEDQLTKWAIPSGIIVPGNGYVLFFADAYSNSVVNGEYHCNFSLSDGGEYLALVQVSLDNITTNIVHEYSPEYLSQRSDVSFGVRPEVTNEYVIVTNMSCTYLIPTGATGHAWWEIGFDDSGWTPATNGLGYETIYGDYDDFIGTVVPATTGLYVRFEFTPPADLQLDDLELQIRYDDGFVAYLNDTNVWSANAPTNAQWNSTATTNRENIDAVNFEAIGLGAYKDHITPGGTNVLAIHAVNYDPANSNSDMLVQVVLIAPSHSPGDGSELRYFNTPTPYALNELGELDYLKNVKFSEKSGYREESFWLELTNASPEAEIRYTLNFSTPTETNSLYTNRLWVDPTTVIRARAFREGYEPSWPAQASYLSIDDVVTQPRYPDGFPTNDWGSSACWFYINSNQVSVFHPDKITNSLKSLPVLSMVTDNPNLFRTNYVNGGLFVYPTRQGVEWERPVSLEWINSDGTDGFKINAGFRIYGNASRSAHKKSMRILFKRQYGAGKLRYPVFGPDAAEEFDSFILGARGQGHFPNAASLYIRNEIAHAVQLRCGGVGSHYTRCHVFINGLYWGMYGPIERPDRSFSASYFPGEKEDWDSIHDANIASGSSIASWQAMTTACKAGLSNNVSFQAVQGKRPDGTVDPDGEQLIDFDDNIIYMFSQMWIMKNGAPGQFYAACGRPPYRTGFKWYSWDSDGCLNTPTLNNLQGGGYGAYPYIYAMENDDFRMLFADYAHKFMFNDGPMTPDNAVELYQELIEPVEAGIYGEAARWWYWTTDIINNWYNYKAFCEDNCRQRTPLFIEMLKEKRLYPWIDAPDFNQNGGLFEPGFEVTITSSNTIYYTLDGGDPREWITGAVGASAMVYSNAIPLAGSSRIRARAFGPYLGTNFWSAIENWFFTPSQLGDLRITEVMYHAADAPEVSPWSTADFDFIELHNSGTNMVNLEWCRFSRGISFTFTNYNFAADDYLILAANTNAFADRYGTVGITIAGQYSGSLDDGGERITLIAASNDIALVDFTYGDGRDWPLVADGTGHSLVPETFSSQSNDLMSAGANWRSSAYINGSPGKADPDQVRDIVINEIDAHTDYTNDTPPYNQYDSDDWVELFNTSTDSVTMTDWYLSDDMDELRKWQIPATNIVASDGFVTFREIHGFHWPITNGFGLNKDGEQVFLSHMPGGDFNRVADWVEFKGQENGVTLGRYPDGSDFWMTIPPSTNGANAAPSNTVVINEIMYHPAPTLDNPENNENDEYVELFNATDQPIQLWNSDGLYRLNGGVEYDFPTNTTIPAKGFVVVVPFDPAWGEKREELLAAYGLADGQVTILGPYAGRLSNEGERLALERPQAPDVLGGNRSWVIVDEATYFDQTPWPDEADGTGNPLQRIDVHQSGNDPWNWSAGFAPSPGQPQAKIGITSPRNNSGFVLPMSDSLMTAVVDVNQVDGTLDRIEFMKDAELIGTDTNEPYEVSMGSITNLGTYSMTAIVYDDGGSETTTPVIIYVASIDNGDGVSLINDENATLNGTIQGDGELLVSFFWGPYDGGTNKSDWAGKKAVGPRSSGPFSAAIDGLAPNKTYYYRSYAENAIDDGWAASTVSFTTLGISTWSNRMKIAFEGYGRSESLSNFPALVTFHTAIPGFDYADFSYTNASDLRFADPSGLNMLNYELALWVPGGDSHVWVQVPSLVGTNSYVYAYWGNSNATVVPSYSLDGSAWGEEYNAVLHMEGEPTVDSSKAKSLVIDSSIMGSGVVGDGRYYDGASMETVPKLYEDWYQTELRNMTFQLWTRPEGISTGTVFGGWAEDVGRNLKRLEITQQGDMWEFAIRKRESQQFTCEPGQWQMLTLVLDNLNAYMYKNAELAPLTHDYDQFTPDNSPGFGFLHNWTNQATLYYSGLIDECSVAAEARSSNWVWASWINIASNSDFAVCGTVGPNVYDPDSDSDEMPDLWEIKHFGGINELDCGPDEDLDGDGYSNLFEFGAGTDPDNAFDLLQLEMGITNSLMFVRYSTIEATGTYYGGMSRYYDLVDTTNLMDNTWHPVPDWTNIFGDGNDVSFTNFPATPGRFYRVEAKLQ